MTGVVCRLLEDMQQHPSEIDRGREAEQNVRWASSAFVAETGHVEGRSVAHDGFVRCA